MAEGGDDECTVMTLKEALDEYEEMEKVSLAVLGASDPQNCSYSKGYLKRQALYACLTCNPKNAPFFQQGGVCLACSYKCHDGHEFVELYTKRNFRCDCGNKKFPDNPCVLQKDKEEHNEKNTYSQNFSGLYCTCHRPYPDPDESVETSSPMIQCVICEDWFHTEHVNVASDTEDYGDPEQSVELICGDCTPKLKFLAYYEQLQTKPQKVTTTGVVQAAESVDVVTIPNEELCKNESAVSTSDHDTASQDSGVASLPETEGEASRGKSVADKDACPLQDDSSKIEFKKETGTLWSSGWRSKLCRCDTCKVLYESEGVSFLLDEEDTIDNYEAVGKAKLDSEMVRADESLNRQLNELGHVGQIELISGINNMKEALKDFLKEFADSGKILSKNDVEDFFQNLRAKRPRLDLSGAEF